MYLLKVFLTAIVTPLAVIRGNIQRLGCPLASEIVPCICHHKIGDIECRNVTENRLKENSKYFRHYRINSFTIVSSTLEIANNDLFKNIPTKHLVFKDSHIDKFNLFEGLSGLESKLHTLKIQNVSSKHWTFTNSNDFTEFRSIELEHCPQSDKKISEVIKFLSDNLDTLRIHNCTIKPEDNSFLERFMHLAYFLLSKNDLHQVKRRWLPLPAKKLHTYIIMNNPIKSLPNDAFVQMPSLERVTLIGTKLSTISITVFKPIITQLKDLHIYRVPLKCDCEMSWLLNFSYLLPNMDVSCDLPPKLKGENVRTLTYNKLCPNTDEIHLPCNVDREYV